MTEKENECFDIVIDFIEQVKASRYILDSDLDNADLSVCIETLEKIKFVNNINTNKRKP